MGLQDGNIVNQLSTDPDRLVMIPNKNDFRLLISKLIRGVFGTSISPLPWVQGSVEYPKEKGTTFQA